MPSFNLYKNLDFIQTLSPATLSPWNLVRGISQTYNLATEIPGASNFSITGTTPPNISINAAGVITADPPHLYTTEIEQLTINSSLGDADLPVTIRDWFPDDSEIDLSTFHSAFRSFDGSAQELWRGIYWYPLNNIGNLNTTEAITVMSGDDGYLDIDALTQQLIDINSNGIFYVTQITDQIAGHNLIAGANTEPLAMVLFNNSLFTNFTRRRNGHLFFRGRWNPNTINSAWSGDNRNISALAATTPELGDWWGAITVQQKHNGANNRTLQYGDNNSYPGVRDYSVSRYRYNTRGTRPDVLFPGLSAYEDPHCVMLSQYLTPGLNINKTIESVRLEDANAHTSENVLALNTINEQFGGGGRDLHFGDFWWAEAMHYEIPEGDTTPQRQVIEDDWENVKTHLANNYTAVIGNSNLNYDLTT